MVVFYIFFSSSFIIIITDRIDLIPDIIESDIKL